MQFRIKRLWFSRMFEARERKSYIFVVFCTFFNPRPAGGGGVVHRSHCPSAHWEYIDDRSRMRSWTGKRFSCGTSWKELPIPPDCMLWTWRVWSYRNMVDRPLGSVRRPTRLTNHIKWCWQWAMCINAIHYYLSQAYICHFASVGTTTTSGH